MLTLLIKITCVALAHVDLEPSTNNPERDAVVMTAKFNYHTHAQIGGTGTPCSENRENTQGDQVQ